MYLKTFVEGGVSTAVHEARFHAHLRSFVYVYLC